MGFGTNSLCSVLVIGDDQPTPTQQLVDALNRAGLMVDVSHVSKASMMQAAEVSRSPVMATHTACRALRDHPRNIDDEQLDALERAGGLVQITAVSCGSTG